MVHQQAKGSQICLTQWQNSIILRYTAVHTGVFILVDLMTVGCFGNALLIKRSLALE